MQNMVAIHADPVTNVNSRRSAADEDGPRDEMLKMPFGCKQPFPIRKVLLLRLHTRILTRYAEQPKEG